MFLLGQIASGYVLWRLLLASFLWVALHLLIRFHPRGIEHVGVVLILLGLGWWVAEPLQPLPFGLTLLLVGILIHAIGRMLYHLRVRKE